MTTKSKMFKSTNTSHRESPLFNQRIVSFMLVCVLFTASAPETVQANDDLWRFCGKAPDTLKKSASIPDVTSESEVMNFSADQVNVEGSLYKFEGKVVGQRGNQQLSADSLDYNKDTDIATARGNVRYELDGRVIVGDKAEINIGDDSGSITPARFWLTDRHIRAQTEAIHMDGPTLIHMDEAIFTTCDEGSDDWLLKASSLTLDTENNEGIARHARIDFMHVPIFYFPYLSFPLEGRKTGFLVPSIAESTQSGTEVTIPYYWNIAPHRDATLTPRLLSRRGVLMESEFRYLNPHNTGQVNLEYINDDRIYGDNRSAVSFQHRGRPAQGWHTSARYRSVSDQDYLDDFSSELAKSSVTHLERLASVDYQGNYMSAGLKWQAYQTIDESTASADRPYQRLPQLNFQLRDWRGPAGMRLGLESELVNFDRSSGVTGKRLNLHPRVSRPWYGTAGHIIPRLSYQHTQYQLENSDPAFDESPTIGVPLFSVDSGLVFERQVSGDRPPITQTLEPRLFYLYVPYRDQTNLIVDESGAESVFDTSQPEFSLNHLYRENRFSGGDRVGDANQINATLTTRMLNGSGRELIRASVGRMYYFRDREVTLPGGQIETDSASDWVAEASLHWSKALSARASVLWDARHENMQRSSGHILYQKDPRRILKLAYRYEKNSLEQGDVAFMWPLATRWNLIGRWLQSLKDDVTLETLKGVEYESCCWTARIVQRKYRINAADDNESDSIWFQLELKGLTSLGRSVKDLLERDILSP